MPTMRDMEPSNAIAPTPLVKRINSERWHLQRGKGAGGYAKVMCDQRPVRVWYSYQTMTAYNAEQVTCTDCLVAAISEGGAKR